ncbi:adenosine kinase [Mariluticola halotolerans]|uniref:adenosine kinase n=1 Tax=Mariluticola halotolerans TaxID=2909283 RepID=UPI0026E2BBA4|nr:adenosine kinase [Mariluticola halotolerans]UJQ93480.1 adenosine kinase [Mariluticola halotolerans]
MAEAKYDVLTIGNAITDILARVEEDFITSEKLDKGIMHLIEGERSEHLYALMPEDKQQISGGSAANTAAGVASLGGNAAFVGKVAEDEVGEFYANDLREAGVDYTTRMLEHGAGSGRSMILITPDGERTMNTYLGACHDLTEADILEDQIGSAAITFMEGYLWDPPEAKRAFVKAAHFAHKHERAAAITLSDPFCVNRFRDEFLDLLRSQTCDYVFANVEELKALYQTDNLHDAVQAVAQDAEVAAITMGADGAMAIANGEVITVPAFKVDKVEDATGAGDLFASGFLFGLARNQTMEEALKLGCLSASEVISHVGARPLKNLRALALTHGLAV